MRPLRQQDPFGVRVAAKRGDGRHVAGAGSQVPLRTRTVAAPRLRLDTYHDSEAIREAFARLQRSCGLYALDEAEELAKLRGAGGPPALNALPAPVLLHCLSFAGLHALGALVRVSRRFAALATAHPLWSAREELRRAIAARQAHWQAEVARHEEAYVALEQRLHARAEADMAERVDVRAALASPTGPKAAAQDTAVDARVERLEAAQAELFRALAGMRAALAEQKNRTEAQAERNGNGNGNEKNLALSPADVQAFERRICRVVLDGVEELPIVLRRGIGDFGTMEMLCMHGGGHAGENVRQRWAAFKRFFPLSDDYGAVRAALASDEETSAKAKEAAERLGAIIRRVQQMTDNEIVQIVM